MVVVEVAMFVVVVVVVAVVVVVVAVLVVVTVVAVVVVVVLMVAVVDFGLHSYTSRICLTSPSDSCPLLPTSCSLSEGIVSKREPPG